MKKQLMSMLLIISMLCVFLVPAAAANDAVLDAKNGVVETIMAYSLDDGTLLEISYGSGFLINDHAVLTCYHCVAPESDVIETIEELTGKSYNPDKVAYRIVVSGDVTRTATVWPDAYSEQYDWAVLKLNDTINGRDILPLGNSDNTETDNCYALGFPDSSSNDVPKYTSEDVTVTSGVVSKLTTINGLPTIEHDAQTSAGSSGGPLVNENGEVIGVNYGGRTEDGANYTYLATQINTIKPVLDALSVEYTESSASTEPTTPTEPAATESSAPTSETVTATPDVQVENDSEDKQDQEENVTEVVDTSALEALIDQAESINSDDYTATTYGEMILLVPGAESLVQFPTTQEEVDAEAVKLQEAIDNLEKESGKLPLVLGIVGACILIVVVVVVIVVVSSSKKKNQKVHTYATVPGGPGTTGNATVSDKNKPSSNAPVPPFATRSTGNAYPNVPADSIGATSVLGGDGGAGETTVLGAGNSAKLTRNKNNETTRINRNEFIIGKERAKVDCCISDNSSVSRRHAKIMTRAGKYYLVDLGSTNGTYVNGAKTPANMETEIFDGDKIKISDEEFTFHC